MHSRIRHYARDAERPLGLGPVAAVQTARRNDVLHENDGAC